MPNRKKVGKNPGSPLDSILGKRGKGRPGVIPSEIVGRADNYRGIFSSIWDTVGKQLLQANSKEDVIKAFELEAHYKSEFSALVGLTLKVVREKKFPKTREAQINFLARIRSRAENGSAPAVREIFVKQNGKNLRTILSVKISTSSARVAMKAPRTIKLARNAAL